MAEDQHIGSADKFSPCILNENISANFPDKPRPYRGRPGFQSFSQKLDSRNLEWKIIFICFFLMFEISPDCRFEYLAQNKNVQTGENFHHFTL